MIVKLPYRPTMAQGLALMLRLGGHLFPISPSGKTPLTASGAAFGLPGLGGHRLSTNDPRIVRHYWLEDPLPPDMPEEAEKLLMLWRKEDNPNAGVNLFMSGMFVLDADDMNSLRSLLMEKGSIPPTMVVKSTRAGGGRHYYFKAPEDTALRRQVPSYGGLDIKHRGYVLIPGSCKRDDEGNPLKWYEIERPPPVSDPPDWLMEMIVKPVVEPLRVPTRVGPIIDGWDPEVLGRAKFELAASDVGGRNETLNKFAFLIGQSVAVGELDEIRARFVLRCAAIDAGLSEHEAMMTIQSGMISGMRAVETASKEE